MRRNTTKIETHANTCYKVVSNTCRGEDGEAPLLVRCKWSQKSRRGHDLTRSNTIPQSPVTRRKLIVSTLRQELDQAAALQLLEGTNNQARVPTEEINNL